MGILNQPIKVRNLELKSRLVMAPMETRKADNCYVSEELCQYYKEKSQGGYLGLLITEHCFVSQDGKACKNQLCAAKDDAIEGLRAMASIIHSNHVPVLLQISHAGSKAKSEVTGYDTISASEVNTPGEEDRPLPKAMTQEEIERIIEDFVAAALRAEKAGYDGVELHSAHGYLLDQFYSPLTNKRTGEYAGDNLAGRTRLHVQIIEKIRQKTNENFIISVRLGACDYMKGGATKEELATTCKILQIAGADLISISGGMCIYSRPGHKEAGWFAELSEEAKKSVDLPILLTGGIKTKEEAETFLANNSADLIGVGRAILKDSKLPEKMLGSIE